MLKNLQQKWKVNIFNLVLIIATFAIGGSLCGWMGRKLLLLTGIDKGFVWILLYIILVTILWPVSVLFISLPLGQFPFFKQYLIRVWNRMSGKTRGETSRQFNIAIFASGSGTNAQKIINYFNHSSGHRSGKVALVVCNNPDAGVAMIARDHNIPVLFIQKQSFLNGDGYLNELKKYRIDLIVLAGFLWKVPATLLNVFPKRIINIHPALLPAYGGKGMYGKRVHEAVLANKEKRSGISIHFADELYDHGDVIKQVSCEINDKDTIESISKKIQLLEHEHYPAVIEEVLKTQISR